MVKIDKVYTRGGDKGQTSLIGGERVSKSSPLIECYGTVDELNACVGMVCAGLEGSPAADKLVPILQRIQQELFNLGAQLAAPSEDMQAKLPKVEDRHIERLEADIDGCQDELEPLTSFVLPGGGGAASTLHLARTVCRRAERVAVAAAEDQANQITPAGIRYLNRLSDALFVFSRWVAVTEGRAELLWTPETT